MEFRKEQEILSYKLLCQWAKSYGVTIQTKPLRVLSHGMFCFSKRDQIWKFC